MQETFSVLEDCRIPVLAAVQGGCIGGAIDLTTACDMRYATENAYFSIQETNIGMTADVGTFPRITNLIPEGSSEGIKLYRSTNGQPMRHNELV